MGSRQQKLNLDSELNLKKSNDVSRRVFTYLLRAFACSVLLAVAAYAVLSIVLNTDLEGRLKRENAMYEKLYDQVASQTEMLSESIMSLQYKDNAIYSEVFQSEAPSIDPVGSLPFLFGSDTIPPTKVINYVAEKADRLVADGDLVEKNFRNILMKVAGPAPQLPPMDMPLKNLSFTQIGASVGMKTNPYYNARTEHNGIDFIVSQGTPVYAPADGKVSLVVKSSKGSGNEILITHPGGYVTRYAHLSEISVNQGQTVVRGRKIGTVGMTGYAIAPHLHYEVIRSGEYLDPVNFLFGSLSVKDYSNAFYMALNTEQSMD